MDSSPSYPSPYPYPQSPPAMSQPMPQPMPQPVPPPSMPPPPLPTDTITSRVTFSKENQHMICPHCHANITTLVESEKTMKAHLTMGLLCLLGCIILPFWLCALCSYCTDSMIQTMDSCLVWKHYCPACDSFLGASEN